MALIRGRGEKPFGYGASSKGNVIFQWCGLMAKDMPCIAEVKKEKFGALTPGTHIPIVSEEARAEKPEYFFVVPWHFRNHVVARDQEYLRQGGIYFSRCRAWRSSVHEDRDHCGVRWPRRPDCI